MAPQEGHAPWNGICPDRCAYETLSELIEGRRLSAPDARSEPVHLATPPVIRETPGAENRDVLGRDGLTLTLTATQAPSHGSNRKGQTADRALLFLSLQIRWEVIGDMGGLVLTL